MIKKLSNLGPLFIALAAFLWSLDALIRTTLYALPPTVVVFWEHVLGAVILLPFAYTRRQEISKLTQKEWRALALVGLFSGALGTMLYTAALGKVNYIDFSVVPLLQQLQPVWAITAAAVILKEKISKNFLGWAMLALVATYLITFKNLQVNMASDSQTIIAALYALLAGVMWGSATAFSKIVLHKVSFITASLLRFAIVPVFSLILVFLLGDQSQLFALSLEQWLRLLAITFSTGGVALVIYYYGLRLTPARVSTLAELTWPASAILIGYFVFGNILSLTQILGIGLLIVAIYQVSTRYVK